MSLVSGSVAGIKKKKGRKSKGKGEHSPQQDIQTISFHLHLRGLSEDTMLTQYAIQAKITMMLRPKVLVPNHKSPSMAEARGRLAIDPKMKKKMAGKKWL
jgi:hypothetical protein